MEPKYRQLLRPLQYTTSPRARPYLALTSHRETYLRGKLRWGSKKGERWGTHDFMSHAQHIKYISGSLEDMDPT